MFSTWSYCIKRRSNLALEKQENALKYALRDPQIQTIAGDERWRSSHKPVPTDVSHEWWRRAIFQHLWAAAVASLVLCNYYSTSVAIAP